MFKNLLEVIAIVFYVALLAFVGFTVGTEVAKADTIKIAVIDSGFNMKYKDKVKLCPEEDHRDLTGTGLNDITEGDFVGHGTNIVGLIAKQIDPKVDYCIMIIKYYTNESTGKENLDRTILAFNWAIIRNANIINYSGGGYGANDLERHTVQKALKYGIKIVAAAGNDSKNLNLEKYYPAGYDPRIIVVGNKTVADQKHESTNYGDMVDYYEVGVNQKALGITLTGTSQATAIRTGKIVNTPNSIEPVRNPFGEK